MGQAISSFFVTGFASNEDVASMHKIHGFWKSVVTSGVYSYACDAEIIITSMALAGLVWIADEFCDFTIDIDNIHTFLNLLMACLSVHRLNTAASRWWEARCAWQTMIGDVRFLVCRIFSSGYKDPQLAQAFTVCVTMYPYCVMQRLSDPNNAYFINRQNIKEFLSEHLDSVAFPGDPDGELWKCIYHEYESPGDMKLYGFMGTKLLEAAQIMIYKADNFRENDEVGAITDQDATQLSENLHNVARQFGSCMKIAETPLLSQISGFVRLMYIIMLAINAFEIGSNKDLSTGIGMIAVGLTSMLILCFDKIVVGLERPFNPALPTSLDLKKYCSSVRLQTSAALKVYSKYYKEYKQFHDPNLMNDLYDTMTRDYDTCEAAHERVLKSMSSKMRLLDRHDSLEALTEQKKKEKIDKTLYNAELSGADEVLEDKKVAQENNYDMSPVLVEASTEEKPEGSSSGIPKSSPI